MRIGSTKRSVLWYELLFVALTFIQAAMAMRMPCLIRVVGVFLLDVVYFCLAVDG
ncbi:MULTISPECIES: hypothetical protein [unclassified Myroides]|uniref:hypothetical protein n=1 Tax=unclassified Myroides TaxID=2642485 RepID=UPI003D2F870C